MIDKLAPLEIPPGLVTNGTMYQRAGRWAGGNLVRFDEAGDPRAILGTAAVTTTGSPAGGTPRGAFAFNDGSRPILLVGSTTKIYSLEYSFSYPGSPHAWVDQSPAAFGADATWWQFDRLGDGCIGVNSLGKVYEIGDGGAAATDITPSGLFDYTGLVVTPERFLVLLRYGADGPEVQWASQGTRTTFTPTSTNSAGSIGVPGDVPLMTGRRTRGGTLLWSSNAVYRLNYVGAPFYYGVALESGQCGLIAPNAVAMAGNDTVWMGLNGFYIYNGYVQPLPCPVADSVFGNMASAYKHRIFTQVVGDEVWWYYPSSAATAPDKVVIYNWRLRAWSLGTISRSAGISEGAWLLSGATGLTTGWPTVPVSLTESATPAVHEHEQAATVMSGAYIETGPIMMDAAGANRIRVQHIVADNVQTSAAEDMVVYYGGWPKENESFTTYSIPVGSGEIDTRITGRYIRLKQNLTRYDSRVGKIRVGVESEGRR